MISNVTVVSFTEILIGSRGIFRERYRLLENLPIPVFVGEMEVCKNTRTTGIHSGNFYFAIYAAIDLGYDIAPKGYSNFLTTFDRCYTFDR